MTDEDETVSVTVLLATHNGAGTLERVLDAYTGFQLEDIRWQLVVVDNASSDATPQILDRYASRLPLVPLRTERRGKNIALNMGLSHCTGELVIFTDDDAVPGRHWLQEWLKIAREQPRYDVFGGGIYPLWPDVSCPEWIPRLVDLGAAYAVTPEGRSSGPIGAEWVWGPNMAVRRRVFDCGHRFDESVGPAGGQYMMGSETEFTRRMERCGFPAWFAPEVRVGHIIRSEQLDPKWLVSRAYRLGRQYFREDAASGEYVPRFYVAPAWIWRSLVKQYLRSMMARLIRDFDSRFQADWQIGTLRGYLQEALRSTR
jgi:glycosyltransferase involved in cell wall biosynthesis